MLQHGPVLTEVTNFMASRIILTAGELNLFTALDEKPATAQELAGSKRLNLRALGRILDALTSLGLLSKEGEIYALSEQGKVLSEKHPETELPMVLHMNRLWDTWSGLSGIVRRGAGARRKTRGTDRMTEKSRRAFIGAMDVIGRSLSIEIAETYDLQPFGRLLDIGGASGTYTVTFLRKNPTMTAVIFDLEDVIPMARERIASEGLTGRVDFAVGDFYRDDLPGGCDLALLSAIIHQNSPRQNLGLFRKVYAALEPGGVVLIRDHIMDETRTRPTPGTLFAINMLVNTSGGGTYTFSEVRKGLERAGFEGIRLVRTGERMDGLVEGRKRG
jgi:SAM-dependent methyltransferase